MGENRRIDYKISLRVKSRSSSLDVKEDVGLALGHRVRVGGKNRRVVEVIPVAVFRHKCSVVTSLAKYYQKRHQLYKKRAFIGK